MKSTAISASWLGLIQSDAKKKFNENVIDRLEKSGIISNEQLILMLVLPIHYNNLKSLDVNNVSTCVCMLLLHEVSCFII